MNRQTPLHSLDADVRLDLPFKIHIAVCDLHFTIQVPFQSMKESEFCLKRHEKHRETEGRMTLWSNWFAFFLAWKQGDVIPSVHAGSCLAAAQCWHFRIAKPQTQWPFLCFLHQIFHSLNCLLVAKAGDLSLVHGAAFRTLSQQKSACSPHNQERKQFLCELALMQLSLEERSCK